MAIMREDSARSAHEDAAHTAQRGEHAHPGPRRYVMIAVYLAILTAFEVALSYADINHGLIIAGLLVLAIVKFSLVAMFFMHLRFDNRLFTVMFAGGLAIALTVFVAVLTIQRVLFV